MSIEAPGRTYYLAEWYRPRLTTAELDDAATKLGAGVAAASSDGSDVRLLVALAMPTDDVLFALFAAASAQLVSDACRRAGIPAERLTYALGAADAITR
jgi:hypothetical protein